MKAFGILLIVGIGLQSNVVWSSFIEYGNFELFRGHRFGQLVPGEGNSFYTLGYTKVNMTYSIPTFRLYQNNRMLKEVPAKFLSANSNERDQDFFRFQDHLVLLTESKQFGKHEFFFHALDLALNQSKKQNKVLSLDLKINETLSHYGYVMDPGSTHLLLYALIEDATNLTFRIHFSIFDAHLNQLEKGSKELIFPSDNTLFHGIHLSNDNNILATFKVLTRNPNRYHLRYLDLKAFYTVDLRKTQNSTIAVKIPEKKVVDLVVHPLNNQNWLLTGLWLDENSNTSGIFSSTFNTERNEYFNEFDWIYARHKANNSLVGNAHKTQNKAFSHAPKSPLTNFIIREFHPHKDGYLLLLEESYRDGLFIENQTGGLIDNLSYNNNTILVIRFDKLGQMHWTREINKTMAQTTNRNEMTSFKMFTNGDRLTLLFNDNRKNYNEFGSYNERNYTYTSKKRENAVAQVHIDLDLGTVSRKMITDFSASKGFFLPLKSTVSTDQSFLFLSFQQSLSNQMYRFGMMRLD